METSACFIGINVEASGKTKDKTTIRPGYATPEHVPKGFPYPKTFIHSGLLLFVS